MICYSKVVKELFKSFASAQRNVQTPEGLPWRDLSLDKLIVAGLTAICSFEEQRLTLDQQQLYSNSSLYCKWNK